MDNWWASGYLGQLVQLIRVQEELLQRPIVANDVIGKGGEVLVAPVDGLDVAIAACKWYAFEHLLVAFFE